jgi:hypothetical protein
MNRHPCRLVVVAVCLCVLPLAAWAAEGAPAALAAPPSGDTLIIPNRSCETPEGGIAIGDRVLMNLPPGALVPSEPELKQVAICNCSSTICIQPICAPPKTCRAVPCLTSAGSCLNRLCH